MANGPQPIEPVLAHAAGTTRARLIEAAERRIAAVGIDATSLRAINAEAGLNVAAVHYHFRTKEMLVRSALDYRMADLAARRQPLLDTVGADPVPSVRALAEAFVQPLDDVRRHEAWGPTYLRFLASLSRAGEPWRTMLTDRSSSYMRPYLVELRRALPDVPATVVRLRHGWASLTAITALADLDTELAPRMRPQRAVECLVDYLTGALTSPTT